MKIILNDFVENLGERGQTVEVKPGYARNYLLPRRLAYPDTPGNRKRFAQEQKHWEDMDLSRRGAAEKVAADLSGVELRFDRRAGENDVLFGSVNAADIARELAAKGFDLERRRVILDEPIKSLGRYEVVVSIHRDIQVTIPVHVARPGEQVAAAATPVPERAAAEARA
jgi:large subunit ribosomal protein L9